jgi:cytochrome P450
MVAYFNFLTFDLIGDLSFASPFDALQNREAHPWMSTFFKSIIEATILGQLLRFPIIFPILVIFSGPLQKSSKKQMEYTQEKVRERIEAGSERPDFMAQVLKNNDFGDVKRGMTRSEIDVTFNLLMLAGSETTATLLSGCMNLLARNERVVKLLKEEVRGAFAHAEDITVLKVCKYLFEPGSYGRSMTRRRGRRKGRTNNSNRLTNYLILSPS